MKGVLFSATEQLTVFLIFIALGMIISFLYDLFRIRRRAFKLAGFFVHIEDLLFWLICAVLVPVTVYAVHYGEFRGYLALGIFTGLVLYSLLFSKAVMDFSVPLVLTVKRVFIAVFKVLTKPLVFAWFFIAKILNGIFKVLSVLSGKAARKVEFDLFKVLRKFRIIFFKK
jgi:spore cortex biosynthesis protein YabQ